MEELSEIKQHIALRSRPPNGEKRRHKSSAEAQPGEILIQRVFSAAKVAFENSKSSRERQIKQANEQKIVFENKSQWKETALVPDDVPEIYVENDIDGLCYLGGPRRRSLRDDNNNNNEGSQ